MDLFPVGFDAFAELAFQLVGVAEHGLDGAELPDELCGGFLSDAGASGNVENVIQAFKNGSSKGLSNDDLKLYNSVRKQFESSVGSNKAQYEAVTDVYGGMTGNVLRTSNGYGHKTSYWNDPTMAGKELWAEYFSYNMSGSKENLEHLREYFPEAANVLEKYAYSM